MSTLIANEQPQPTLIGELANQREVAQVVTDGITECMARAATRYIGHSNQIYQAESTLADLRRERGLCLAEVREYARFLAKSLPPSELEQLRTMLSSTHYSNVEDPNPLDWQALLK